MLVLTRRCDENFVFPGLGITVKILQIKGNQVKIGIDAPESVVILRGELEQDSFHGRLPPSSQCRAGDERNAARAARREQEIGLATS